MGRSYNKLNHIGWYVFNRKFKTERKILAKVLVVCLVVILGPPITVPLNRLPRKKNDEFFIILIIIMHYRIYQLDSGLGLAEDKINDLDSYSR